MFNHYQRRQTLLALISALAIAACSDSTSELISEGGTGGGTPPPTTTPPPTNGGGDGGDPPPSEGACPAGTSELTIAGQTQCEIQGTLTGDVTLTANNVYSLNGGVFVGEDMGPDPANPIAGRSAASLTIEPGTVIYGQTTDAILVVSRGSEIFVNGTSTEPVVMTSAEDLGLAAEFGRTQRAIFTGNATDDPNTGEWGGFIVNGRAPINVCGDAGTICVKLGEGDSGEFGGNDPDDDSGRIAFLQVKYAGFEITPGNELNGLALQGVGRGTEVDFVQVHNNADDGVEFFGGTVDAKHIVVTGADDDSIDWTDGWQGRLQFALVLQNPNQPNSDRAIEADNFEENNDFTPRSQPVLSNLTLIGAADRGIGDTGIVLRRGTGGEIYNTVVSNFLDACLDLDDPATFAQANPQSATAAGAGLRIGHTLLDCAAPIENEADDVAFGLEAWFLAGAGNIIGSSSLSGFINGPVESSAAAFDIASTDPFFDAVDFIGAIPNGDARTAQQEGNWTLGWTFGLNPDPTCPDAVGVTATANGDGCILEGTLTGTVRLAAGLDYFLRGGVFVGEDLGPDPANPIAGRTPGELIIDAGVTLQGENTSSILVVSRGSKIFANGTATAPVVMTAINPDTRNVDLDSGLWGGFIVNGRAPINVCGDAGTICVKLGEGDSGEFGGNDPDDDSGQIFFTRVEYAGFEITPGNELNGLALQGVGRGTEIDFVQVHNNADDGVEFFGGTVDAKHIVVTGADDDSIDWTDGWQGRLQFGLVVQNPNQPNSDRAIEADNFEENNNFTPRSQPVLSNLTLIGAADRGIGDTGIVLRRGTGGEIYNSVVSNFLDACLDLDDPATFAQADPQSATAAGAGLRIGHTLLDCAAPIENEADDVAFGLEAWFLAGAGNAIGASSLQQPLRGGKAFVNGANEAQRPAEDPSAIDPFFDSVDFIGAIESPETDWTAGWTIWLDRPAN
ncbi:MULTISPECIES: hypothetical protein [unclassified Iodidimonas]|jgi:hypothetical protein|uniref:hypothetical protein n=1 Tax=unclassified Iodidimonas TaxID=2626145 RepID=UPI002482E893|nr:MULTISPECIES: hypothetical protein [unclassified Iodidimonas]